MLNFIKKWLEDRTGAVSGAGEFMGEQVPKSVGWRNTLGSVAGALLLLQILTGFLMMIFYVPHPDWAYKTIEYIEQSIAGGSLVRALHYWGASFLVVALFLHVCRVFFAGAYRKPREVTWLTGLALFGVVLALAFTGQLLPYNQAGYWAAKVGIEIASAAPGAGPFIKSLLTGGETLGALTLTRFYAGHVVLFPALLGALVLFHLYLLRRHGPARAASDTSSATVPFFPNQVFKDMVVISIVLGLLFAVGLIVGGPVSDPADPTDTSYLPHPEWYLMSHFQILKVTPGNLKVLATFVLPNLFVGGLVLLPWLDRSKSAALKDRRPIVALGAMVIATLIGLTAWGVATKPEQKTAPRAGTVGYDPVVAGAALYEEFMCSNCHRIDGEGEQVGPDLSHVGNRLRPDYMARWLRNPPAFVPDTQMPPTKANARQLEELVAYLQSLREPAV